MRISKHLIVILIGLAVNLPAAYLPSTASAQATSYLDESGNLHFVDSPSQIPERYRQQLTPPKPTVVTQKQYKVELKEWQKKKKTEDKERKKREKEKAKERKRLEKEMNKRDRQRANTKQSSSAAKEAGPGKFNSEANATPAPIVR